MVLGQMDRLQRCRVLIGASCESVFMRNCVDCTFSIAWCVPTRQQLARRVTRTISTCSKQLRTRDCARCVTHLYAKTDPIIEKSYAMEFLPYNVAYPCSKGVDSVQQPPYHDGAVRFVFSYLRRAFCAGAPGATIQPLAPNIRFLG